MKCMPDSYCPCCCVGFRVRVEVILVRLGKFFSAQPVDGETCCSARLYRAVWPAIHRSLPQVAHSFGSSIPRIRDVVPKGLWTTRLGMGRERATINELSG